MNGFTNTTKLRDYDFFPTPAAWTRALLNKVTFDGVITEPCCGDGAMVKVLTEAGYTVEASDVQDFGTGYPVQDALTIQSHQNVVTNPPYCIAEDLVQHWLDTTAGKVAVLMRAQWLEGRGRYSRFFRPDPPNYVLIIPERMPVPLTGKSGQFNHAWVVWDREHPATETKLLWSPAIIAP